MLEQFRATQLKGYFNKDARSSIYHICYGGIEPQSTKGSTNENGFK